MGSARRRTRAFLRQGGSKCDTMTSAAQSRRAASAGSVKLPFLSRDAMRLLSLLAYDLLWCLLEVKRAANERPRRAFGHQASCSIPQGQRDLAASLDQCRSAGLLARGPEA